MLFIGTSSCETTHAEWLSLFSSTVVVKRSLTRKRKMFMKRLNKVSQEFGERMMYVSQDLGIATLVFFFSNMLISEGH